MLTQATSRRLLKFNSIDDALAEVKTLADADAAGKLRCLGNWSFGQNLNHIATWVDYCYDGLPMNIPFFVRWVMRTMKNSMLNKPMKAGLKIPRVPGGTLALDAVSTQAGLEHFEKAFNRLAKDVPSKPHVFFGKMTRDQWIALNLRHAELHLSFLQID